MDEYNDTADQQVAYNPAPPPYGEPIQTGYAAGPADYYTDVARNQAMQQQLGTLLGARTGTANIRRGRCHLLEHYWECKHELACECGAMVHKARASEVVGPGL